MQIRSSVATVKGSTLLPVLLGESTGRAFRLRGRDGVVGYLPLGRTDESEEPVWTRDGIVRASPLLGRGRLEGLRGYVDEALGLLAVVPGLSFAVSGFQCPRKLRSPTHAPHRLIWSGGEGLDVIGRTWGGRKNTAQVQMFALRTGQSMLVADEDERIVKVSYSHGVFALESADKDFLVAHVLGRAERANVPQELEWCVQVLREIGRPDLLRQIAKCS